MTFKQAIGRPTEPRAPSASLGLINLGSTIVQQIASLLHRIGPRDDYQYGAGVIALGLAAFVMSGLNPIYAFAFWQMQLQLVCFAGLLVLTGAYALPAASRRWYMVKLLIAAAAVHWMFILPIARYWGRWDSF